MYLDEGAADDILYSSINIDTNPQTSIDYSLFIVTMVHAKFAYLHQYLRYYYKTKAIVFSKLSAIIGANLIFLAFILPKLAF